MGDGSHGTVQKSIGESIVSSYRPSIETFPLDAFQKHCRFCAAAHHFFPPHLVSPKFPYVLLRVGGWLLEYEEQRCGANCPFN